jgi:hypothetical protein
MILFTLRCAGGHEFEAWFRDNAAYDRQSKRDLISCPDCGSSHVEKAPMAPRLGRSTKGRDEPAPRAVESRDVQAEAPAPSVPAPSDAPPTPAEFRRALQVLRRHVETNCENVGKGFAEEARRIHKGEAKERGIYGEATPSEAKTLVDEGIDIAAIPWVPSSDA